MAGFGQLDFELLDDDVEILELLNYVVPRKVYDRRNYFEKLDDSSFYKRFRLCKESVLTVLEAIEADIESPTDRNNSISPVNQLLLTLRFYATGKHLLSVGDFAGMHVGTVSKIVRKVSAAIARLRPRYISFPNTADAIKKAKIDFFKIACFPNVVGAIDCTHIRIQSPGGNDPEVFRNRKSYFSINVQAICNANMEFTDIVARWPGSTHDSTIFNNCVTKYKFEDGDYNNCFLMRDSGYNVRAYLLTPLLNPVTAAEQWYNEAQIRTRAIVEQLFGVWKRRFPILAYGSR